MKSSLRYAAWVAVLSGLCWTEPRAQDEQPAFRAGALTVVVDAIVTDKRNTLVTGLGVDDFIIYEDDVPQKIDSIQFLNSGTGQVMVENAAPPSLQPAREASQVSEVSLRRPNLIIFLLDYATTEFVNQNLVEEAAVKYVTENLRPHDYVAVFGLGAGFGLLQEFTNDRESLIEALKIRDIGGRSMVSTTPTGPSVSPARREAASQMGPVTVTASSPQGMGAAAQAAAAEQSELASIAIAMRIQRMFYTMNSFVQEREARGVLTAIRAIAGGVEGIEGRKTLILFSQGFVIGPNVERALEKTISAANRANLSVYGIDSQGLMNKDSAPGNELYSVTATQGGGNAVSGRRIDAVAGESLFDRAKQVGSDARDSALRFVSASTGGFAIRNTNDLHLGLQRIDEDIRSYYLLSYRPRNQAFDGAFRNIRVETKRAGYSVRHRSGYLALPPGLELLNTEDYQLMQSVQSGQLPTDLPAHLRLEAFPRSPEEQNVIVSLELPVDAVSFRQESGEGGVFFTADLEVMGLIMDPGGAALLRFGTPMNLHFNREEYDAMQRGGLSFNNQIQLPPGEYSFQVIIKDSRTNHAARLEQSLRLQEPENQLRLSTIVLGKEVQSAQPGVDLLKVGDQVVLPSASRRFSASDHLIFYFEAYVPGSSAHAAALPAEVTLLRSGSAQGVKIPGMKAATVDENGRAVFSRFVELKGLPAGTYFLQAVVRDTSSGSVAKGRTVFQLAAN